MRWADHLRSAPSLFLGLLEQPIAKDTADRKGESPEVTYDPSHRWLFYPDMVPEEMLLFKGFDSDPTATSFRTPHSAFDDPITSRDARPRHSIELRAMAFF
jgi:hypothetical protein